jgi:hypothetical protein
MVTNPHTYRRQPNFAAPRPAETVKILGAYVVVDGLKGVEAGCIHSGAFLFSDCAFHSQRVLPTFGGRSAAHLLTQMLCQE